MVNATKPDALKSDDTTRIIEAAIDDWKKLCA
jgi:hypothetical protein